MQIKNNQLNKLQNPWIIGLAKSFILVGCVVFINNKFQSQSISFFEIDWPDNLGYTTGIVSILMIANWYLEALRWKLSSEVFEPLTLKDAWKIVLGGLALNWVLPFTTGDLIARLSVAKDKYQASSAAVLNRGVMLCLTLVIGLYGMSFVAHTADINGLFIIGIVFGFLIFIQLFKKSIKRFFIYFQELSKEILLRIIGISLLRYLVFVFQFYLLLEAFMPWMEWKLIVAGIGWVFLIRSSLPLFFGGVGVREASGIIFFDPHVTNLEIVILPIFMIWIINTVIPSVVGLLVIMQAKPMFSRHNNSPT